MDPHPITPADCSDAGEILALRRAAHVTQAQLYDDVRLPALTQSLPQLEDELATGAAYKATADGRIVGAVRVRQNCYAETHREVLRPAVTLVHLAKPR